MTSISSAAGLLAALLALAAPPAGASPGDGIRLGGSEGRLHPYLDLEGRWDSNVYSASEGDVADVIIHVRPGFELEVPGDLIAVELGANLDWAQYLGLDAEASTDELSRAYGAASLGLTVNRRGSVGLELDDQFRRAASTSAFTFNGAVVSNLNALSVKVPFRPGGGALTVSLTGGWTLETFEPFSACDPAAPAILCDEDVLGDYSYDEMRGGAEVRWRFLPRTSAVLQGSYFSRVPSNTALSPEVSGFDARAGFSGLVTPHLGATLKAGYASTGATYDDPASAPPDDDFGTWLATIEAEWIASDAFNLRVGWDHGYGIDPGNALSVYASDRILLGARYALAGRYGARLDASWETRAYAFTEGSSGDLLVVAPSVEAALSRWMNVSAGYAYTTRTSTFASTPGFDWDKSEAWLRFVFRY
jgi:hypothetical protein